MPIIVNEDSSEEVADLLAKDNDIALWWGSRIECMSALARRWREGTLNDAFLERSRYRFDLLFTGAYEISATNELRDIAENLSFEAPLKAADTLQLAAAIVWRGADDAEQKFVCLDRRLRVAATSKGFTSLPERDAA